jgi:hypothetical protein
MANKVLAGEKLDQKTYNECITKFREYRARLRAKNAGKPPAETVEENAAFYCQAYLMAIIAPDEHGGWPFRYDKLDTIYPTLKKELENKDDTLIMASIIILAINKKDLEYANKVYKKLHEKDPKLSKYANQYIKDYLIADPLFLEFSKAADEIAK